MVAAVALDSVPPSGSQCATGDFARSLWFGDWSYRIEIVQDVPEQNESWTDVSARPPGARRGMSLVVRSEARRTWYKLPSYDP
jgi:hypothetical protein